MRVRIPTPLRSYTAQAQWVDAAGATVGAVLDDLDCQYPGIRFRVIDEQGAIRKHMRIYRNDEPVAGLDEALRDDDVLTLMQALSGG
jgi:sulfur-carrier protein